MRALIILEFEYKTISQMSLNMQKKLPYDNVDSRSAHVFIEMGFY